MTTSAVLADSARGYLLDGTISVIPDTIKVALLASTYNPRPAAAAWMPSVAYAANTIVVSGGMYYEATVSGVSSGTLPLLTTVRGATTIDNTVTWYCWGYMPPCVHSTWAEVSSHEIAGTGYTAGGVALAGKSIVLANHKAGFTASPATWASALFSARFACVYKVGTANAITNPLIGIILLDSANADVVVPTTASFSLVWPALGLFTF